jgi:hypothetical protein
MSRIDTEKAEERVEGRKDEEGRKSGVKTSNFFVRPGELRLR